MDDVCHAPEFTRPPPIGELPGRVGGVCVGGANKAIFSNRGSDSALSHGTYPNVAKAAQNASSVSVRGMPSGQEVRAGSPGHHQCAVSPAAHAMQL
jgi:hypothetical protein